MPWALSSFTRCVKDLKWNGEAPAVLRAVDEAHADVEGEGQVSGLGSSFAWSLRGNSRMRGAGGLGMATRLLRRFD